MEEKQKPKKGHVIVLTYPAQGHINPLLQFTKRLSSKGLKATLATTPYTLNSLQIHPPKATISVEPISDGFDGGGFKHAPDLETYLDSFKTSGSRTLAQLIQKFSESDSPVSCLVYDSILPWGLDVAKQMGVLAAAFFTNSASVCSIYLQIKLGVLTLPVRAEMVPLSLPGLPPLGFSEMPSFVARGGSPSPYLAAVLEQFSALERNDWVFVNSFLELESELAEALKGQWALDMVGPMVPSAFLDQQIEGDRAYGSNLWSPDGDKCSKWLDSKPPNSVVYVSFGSMAETEPKQVEEIAWGLKQANIHFLWVVKESEIHKLPENFQQTGSTKQMGLVIAWCDQLEVLVHRAVGCFVTHCGWNSILEALSLKVPMVGVPQRSDQPMNANFLEVWKVGVRAKEDEEGIVRREELERCVREVLVGGKSEEIRSNSSKWREFAKRAVSRGGSSDQNVSKFVRVLNGEDI